MLEPSNNADLPPIPGKRYFTIGEVSDLCGVKPHVLRYWEQEFPQLKPVKRRGNRRYYQRQDVLIIRQIRSLLYEQGFTIGGARNRLEGDDAQVDVNQLLALVEVHLSIVAGEPIPGSADGKALFIQQAANLPNDQHVLALVIAAVAAAFDGLELREFLLPVAQYVRFDATEIADFADGEVALSRDRR